VILNRRIDEFKETANLYESYLNEKIEEIVRLNQEQKRSDDIVTNNNDIKNHEDIEIFYPAGSCTI
jgi:CHASE3 domain sensor protein